MSKTAVFPVREAEHVKRCRVDESNALASNNTLANQPGAGFRPITLRLLGKGCVGAGKKELL